LRELILSAYQKPRSFGAFALDGFTDPSSRPASLTAFRGVLSYDWIPLAI